MRKKVFWVVLILVAIVGCLCACDKNYAEHEISSNTSTDPTITELPLPSFQPKSMMLQQFFEEAMLPTEIYDRFIAAIQGDASAQEWLDEYDNENHEYFSVFNDVFPSRDSQDAYSENECCYNIGTLYYDGDEDIPFSQNKDKAFYWLTLSADKGSFVGATKAGDMAQIGDGIPANSQVAFDLYEKALKYKKYGMAYERLAYCYENGYGTAIDEQKAQQYYFMSTLDGNIKGLYTLSTSDRLSQTESVLFSKAASSMDYSANYFDMVYEGLAGYTASEAKLETVERIAQAWDNGMDPVANQLRKAVCENQYFQQDFVEALIKTSYTYSFHAFSEKYGIEPNQSVEDINNIQFALSGYDGHATHAYYKLDFDGDGEEEIGIPFNSGAGGAFMADGFAIYKKNSEGLYEEYAYGPNCTFRDAMRLIKYDGRIYFITNPFSDTMNDPQNITARVIDENGQGHEMRILCNEYEPKEIMTKVYEQYNSDDYVDFITAILAQANEAITATKRHDIYNPNNTESVKSDEDYQNDFYDSPLEDVYYSADLNNDGVDEFIRKGHMITESKYYNDYNLFQIYNSDAELLENAVPMLDMLPYDEFYGLHSGGNIYEILPVGRNVVQFWTSENNNITYCVALTRHDLVYALHVYTVLINRPIAVCNSLIFDEFQNVEVNFT